MILLTSTKRNNDKYLFELASAAVSGSTCSKYPQGAVVAQNGRVVACGSSTCLVDGAKSCPKKGLVCRHMKSAVLDAVVQVGAFLSNGSKVVVVDSKTPVPESEVCESVVHSLGIESVTRLDSSGNPSDTNSVTSCEDKVEASTHRTGSRNTVKSYGSAVCPNCGVEFTKTHPRQKFCNKRRIGVCKVCGKVFQYTCVKDKPVTCGNPKCVAEIRRKNVLSLHPHNKENK